MLEKNNQKKDQQKIKDNLDAQDEINKEISQVEETSTSNKKVRLMPRKREFRSRAHINPLNETEFPVPLNPDYVNWRIHFPYYFNGLKEEYGQIYTNTQQYPITYDSIVDPMYNGVNSRKIDFLDIGCGFGGLLFELSSKFPDKLAFGLEIRPKLASFIGEKIKALRLEQNICHNISAIRTNSMRHLLQYIRKSSVEKVFICFPDPQFKARNFRRRIINTGLLSEYAYIMKPKARLYCITDVKDLYLWHLEKIKNHNMFRILNESEYKNDICVQMIQTGTEESKKVDVKQGDKFYIIAERV